MKNYYVSRSHFFDSPCIYDSVYVKSLIVKALAALEPSTNIVNIDVAGCQH